MPAAAQETSSLRTRVKLLHADPSVEEFEVFIDGVEVLEDFAYGQASDWIDVAPGSARVTITADRAGFNVVVYDTVYPVPAGYDYSLIVTEALVYGDVFDTSPVPAGSARVRVVHASLALPAVEVAADGADRGVRRGAGLSADVGIRDRPGRTVRRRGHPGRPRGRRPDGARR